MEGPDFSKEEPVSEPLLELNDRLDETVISLPCYEPAGGRVELTGRALCTHTLLLGQTGSGKTSVLRWFIKSLIHHHAPEADQRAGIFVFDLNGDETVALVRKWAREAGREGDLRLLTPAEGHLELFADIRSLDDLPRATSLFMYGKWAQGSENAYWNETTRTLLDAALSICLMVTGRVETETILRFLTNWLIAQRPTTDDEALLKTFERMAARASEHLDKLSLAKIEMVRATIGVWAKLDVRTKSILTSCLLDAVGGLVSPEARRYLDPSRGSCFLPEAVRDGAILIFSLPAALKLEAASLLGKIIKSRLFTALQGRPQDRNQRLCAVIADEYHYLASGGIDRSSDVTALATLRSRSVALVAASQSLDHLAGVLGAHAFRSLLPNFGNHFFFRSTEATTAAFATALLGTRSIIFQPGVEQGDLLLHLPPVRVVEPVCPPGALTALEPGQAYVSLATGFRSPAALWLAGNHEAGDRIPLQAAAHDQCDRWRKLREQALAPAAPPIGNEGDVSEMPLEIDDGPEDDDDFLLESTVYYDVETWQKITAQPRFQHSSFSSPDEFRKALATLDQTPTGLETLPPCWWDALVSMTRKFGLRHSVRILDLRQEDGCLIAMLAGTAGASSLYLGWIARLQRSLYPSRHRRLKSRDYRLAFPKAPDVPDPSSEERGGT
jgi:hypothetical protein